MTFAGTGMGMNGGGLPPEGSNLAPQTVVFVRAGRKLDGDIILSTNWASDPVGAQLRYHQQGRGMSLEEAILDKVRRLPPAKQEEVLRFADGLRHQVVARMVPLRDRTREMKWIEENRTAYADQWVAVEGDRLIAADTNPQKVFAAAKAEGIGSPFVVHVLPEDPFPFVSGW